MPNIDAIFMIEPKLFFLINIPPSFVPKKHPLEFISFTLSQSGSVVSKRSFLPAIPALFTKISNFPKSFSIQSIVFFHSVSLVVSKCL